MANALFTKECVLSEDEAQSEARTRGSAGYVMRDTALSSGHDVIPVQPGSSRERRNGHVKIQHWHKPHDAPTSACDGAVAAQYWGGVPRVDGPSCTERSILGRKRSEEHTSELQSLMRISYAVFCLKI